MTCIWAARKTVALGDGLYGGGTLRATVPADPVGTATPTSDAPCEASYRFSRGIKEESERRRKQVGTDTFPSPDERDRSSRYEAAAPAREENHHQQTACGRRTRRPRSSFVNGRRSTLEMSIF